MIDACSYYPGRLAEPLEARLMLSSTPSVAKAKATVYKLADLTVAAFPGSALPNDTTVTGATIAVGKQTLATAAYITSGNIEVPITTPATKGGLPGGGRGTVTVTGASGATATFQVKIAAPVARSFPLGEVTEAVLSQTASYLAFAEAYYSSLGTTDGTTIAASLEAESDSVAAELAAVQSVATHKAKRAALPMASGAAATFYVTPAALKVSDQELADSLGITRSDLTGSPSDVQAVRRASVIAGRSARADRVLQPASISLSTGIAIGVAGATVAFLLPAAIGISVGVIAAEEAAIGAGYLGTVLASSTMLATFTAAAAAYLAGNKVAVNAALDAGKSAFFSFAFNALGALPGLEYVAAAVDTYFTFNEVGMALGGALSATPTPTTTPTPTVSGSFTWQVSTTGTSDADLNGGFTAPDVEIDYSLSDDEVGIKGTLADGTVLLLTVGEITSYSDLVGTHADAVESGDVFEGPVGLTLDPQNGDGEDELPGASGSTFLQSLSVTISSYSSTTNVLTGTFSASGAGGSDEFGNSYLPFTSSGSFSDVVTIIDGPLTY